MYGIYIYEIYEYILLRGTMADFEGLRKSV